MLRQEQIAAVIDSQREVFMQKDSGLARESLDLIPEVDSFTTIITGIRRCGKSTLLLQLLKKKYHDALYLNFEDIRLAGFETSDFSRLLNEITLRGQKVCFFDEIQLIDKWDIFIHQILRDGYRVFITGSNASLLSRESGTHLTGRHVSMELFPFSYREYLQFNRMENNAESLQKYLVSGGIPEYIKSGVGTILIQLIDDILVRDITVRHGVRDVNALRQLAVFLMSNIGSLLSANKLAGMYGIKSVSTFLEYFSYLSDAYLLEFMPQFNFSLKAQARNPRKIYSMDVGFVSEMATTSSDNIGHRFENLIYLTLRRRYSELYYFNQDGECDFVAGNRGKAEELVQACYRIDDLNFEREYEALIKAMKFFKKKEGVIVTFNQKDSFEKDGLTVKLVPAYEYCVESP